MNIFDQLKLMNAAMLVGVLAVGIIENAIGINAFVLSHDLLGCMAGLIGHSLCREWEFGKWTR